MTSTIGLWRLDESTGDSPARDETGNYHLAPIGNPGAVVGRINGAREVGSSVSFTLTPLPAGDPIELIVNGGNYTVEAWFNVDPSISYPATWPGPGNGHGSLFNYGSNVLGSNLLVGLDPVGFFHYNQVSAVVVVGSWANIKQGTWHHLAVRSTSISPTIAQLDFFVDGIKIGTTTAAKATATAGVVPQFISIGGEGTAGTFNQFKGAIDDVRFSRIPRTDDEIFQTYHRAEIIYDLLSPAAQRGTDRLLQQYKDATAVGVKEVVAESSNEVQDVNDAFNSITVDIPTATGATLDLLGKIVGEPRQGRTNDVYRVWISAKIRANRSSGTIEDIIDVFRILTGGVGIVNVVEYPPARIVVKVNGYNVIYPNDYLAILRLIRKAGVGYQLEYSTSSFGSGFRFAGGVAGGGKGFPDASLTPGSGGKLAGAL